MLFCLTQDASKFNFPAQGRFSRRSTFFSAYVVLYMYIIYIYDICVCWSMYLLNYVEIQVRLVSRSWFRMLLTYIAPQEQRSYFWRQGMLESLILLGQLQNDLLIIQLQGLENYRLTPTRWVASVLASSMRVLFHRAEDNRRQLPGPGCFCTFHI